MFWEIIKNPVIIGIVAGVIVYTYMSWNRKKENEKRIKKGKKIKLENKYDDIIVPSIVAILVWFITYGYFNYKTEKINQQQLNPTNQFILVKDSPSDNVGKSFTLVTRNQGITLPQTPLPALPVQQPSSIQAGQQIGQQTLKPTLAIGGTCPSQPSQPFGNNMNMNINNNVPDIFMD
jgi:heme/copper-type cytochrome/quinol oxidase subunit 2